MLSLRSAMIAVRGIKRADEAVWRVLRRDHLTFCDAEPPEAVSAGASARLIYPEAHDHHGHFAEDDAGVVGLARSLPHRHGWRIDDVRHLQDFCVAPHRRGAGVGGRPIKAVVAASGPPEAFWLTQTHNAAARRLGDGIGAVAPFIGRRRPTRA